MCVGVCWTLDYSFLICNPSTRLAIRFQFAALTHKVHKMNIHQFENSNIMSRKMQTAFPLLIFSHAEINIPF